MCGKVLIALSQQYALIKETIVSSIKNDFKGDVDAWWENAYLDEEMELISDNGHYGENYEFFIEEDGKLFDVHEYLTGKL